MINLDTTIVNVALPTLVRELHASNSQLQWVVDAFNLLFAARCSPPAACPTGSGARGCCSPAWRCSALASLVGGLMDSPGALIAARAVMGVGAAMVFPVDAVAAHQRVHRAAASAPWRSACGARSRAWRSRSDRSSAAGCSSSPTGAASSSRWRRSPRSPASSSPRYVPTSRDPHAPRTDRAGFALSTATIGLLVYTIIEAPDHGWGSARTLGGFALTAVLAAAFVAWERRTEQPMLDLSLFRNPRFTAASGSVAISFFALSGFIFLVTQYFQFLKGYGPLSTGVRLLPVASSVAISSILGTRLAVRIGTKLVVAAGLFSMAAFYLWVTTTSATTSYATIAAQMVVLGTGMGLTSAPATEAIMGVVPKAKAGVGSAVNDATRLLGGTLGVAVIGSVYASLYASRLTSALPARLPATVARRRARIRRRRAHRRRRAGPRRPPGARVGRPQRRQLGLLPRLPHRQLRRRRRRRRRRPDGARAAARPPDRPARDDTPELPALGSPATAAARS